MIKHKTQSVSIQVNLSLIISRLFFKFSKYSCKKKFKLSVHSLATLESLTKWIELRQLTFHILLAISTTWLRSVRTLAGVNITSGDINI